MSGEEMSGRVAAEGGGQLGSCTKGHICRLQAAALPLGARPGAMQAVRLLPLDHRARTRPAWPARPTWILAWDWAWMSDTFTPPLPMMLPAATFGTRNFTCAGNGRVRSVTRGTREIRAGGCVPDTAPAPSPRGGAHPPGRRGGRRPARPGTAVHPKSPSRRPGAGGWPPPCSRTWRAGHRSSGVGGWCRPLSSAPQRGALTDSLYLHD